MKNGIEEWIIIADKDMMAAKVLMDNTLAGYAAFHCQQAIKSILKRIC